MFSSKLKKYTLNEYNITNVIFKYQKYFIQLIFVTKVYFQNILKIFYCLFIYINKYLLCYYKNNYIIFIHHDTSIKTIPYTYILVCLDKSRTLKTNVI